MSTDGAIVSASIVVDAPAKAVFDILADPRQHARIDGSGSLRGLASGPERLALGSRFGMRMRLGAPYRITNKVVEWDQDRLIAWRHVGVHRWRYELEPVPAAEGGGTRVTETWDGSAYPGFGLAVLRRIGMVERARAGIEATLPKLKAAAEADAAAATGV